MSDSEITLREYLESQLKNLRDDVEQTRMDILARIEAADLRYDQRFHAAEQAVFKAETASEKRFEGVNEFRATLGDQQRTLMPRAESEFMHRAHDEKLNVALTQLTQRMETALVQVNTRLESLSLTISTMQSTGRGTQHGWILAIGAVGLILTVITILAAAMGLLHVGSVK